MTPAEASAWQDAGHRIAPMLGSYSAAVVFADDPLAAAHVALGIGRAEATTRKVAIGDLVGEMEPLQSLVTSDDHHGISDCFTYGISLNKIAQPADTTGNLFIMPSGLENVIDPAIYQNTRWLKLANGFREMGALLLLVAPKDAPEIRELINQTDGVILADLQTLDSAPYATVLARVQPPPPPPEPPAQKTKSDQSKPSLNAKGKKPKQSTPVWLIALLMLGLLALAAATVFWGVRSAQQRHVSLSPEDPRPVTLLPKDTLVLAPPVNPQDSATAAAYAVELLAFNSSAEASEWLENHRTQLPTGTVSPVVVGPNREMFYKVIAGAFSTQDEAERLLRRLQRRKVLDADAEDGAPGTVVRTPYAVLLDSAQAGRTQQLVQSYADVPYPVYVLVQRDRSLKLYTGAFERPEDSAALLAALRKLYPTPSAAPSDGADTTGSGTTDSAAADTTDSLRAPSRDTSSSRSPVVLTDIPRPVLAYRTGRLP